MKFRELIMLFLAGLVFNLGIAWFQHAPGYMDADYYFAGGLRLVRGQGFTETYLWNYLDNPQSLPHPSHAYWFPLASMLAAAGMLIAGQQTFWAARAGFILAAALVPPVTALLAFQITSRRETAYAAGLLAVFSGYHAPFMPTTDNFSIFMLFGGAFFLTFRRQEKAAPFLLGLLAGLMNLARVDGLLWFGVGVLGLVMIWLWTHPRPAISAIIIPLMLFSAGYALLMGPWMARNLSIWGTPLSPAGGKVLWMTRYDDTFAWPASRINLQNWLAAGWRLALDGRLNALKLNAINTIGAQAAFLLFPFILIGLHALRKDLRVRLAVFAWLVLFLVMSVVLPFAGSRGSFFHAGAALQPVWFMAAVVGVETFALKFRDRRLSITPQIFRVGLVFGMAILTLYLAYVAIFTNDWDQFQRKYQRVEAMLVQHRAQPTDAILVANAPGYYVVSNRPSLIVPDENLASVRALASKFGAKFLVLEKAFYTDPMIPVYQNPASQSGLTYIGEFDDVRIFSINP